jgi:hypothetical protein
VPGNRGPCNHSLPLVISLDRTGDFDEDEVDEDGDEEEEMEEWREVLSVQTKCRRSRTWLVINFKGPGLPGRAHWRSTKVSLLIRNPQAPDHHSILWALLDRLRLEPSTPPSTARGGHLP